MWYQQWLWSIGLSCICISGRRYHSGLSGGKMLFTQRVLFFANSDWLQAHLAGNWGFFGIQYQEGQNQRAERLQGDISCLVCHHHPHSHSHCLYLSLWWLHQCWCNGVWFDYFHRHYLRPAVYFCSQGTIKTFSYYYVHSYIHTVMIRPLIFFFFKVPHPLIAVFLLLANNS